LCSGIRWRATSLGLMLDTGLQQEVQEIPRTTASADIVLGILSYDNAAAIGDFTRDAVDSLAAGFPKQRSVVVNADGGVKEGGQERNPSVINREIFVQIAYTIYPAQKISPEHFGAPGKANGMQAIFGVASEMDAAACVIVDSTIGMPGKGSIAEMLRPVMEEEIDFVAPRYLRHKYDAAILNGIIYPLTRALYGRRIHQPIGGDYALSKKLINYLATQKRPDGDSTSSDADAWITAQALSGGFRFAEVRLAPRVLVQHEPAPEASAILAQALGSVFAEMNRSAAFWQRTRGSQPVPLFGPCFEPLADPPPVDPNPMMQSFRLGYQNLQDIYRLVLPPATLMELKRMCLHTADTFHFDDMLWARVVYDFALAWRVRIMDRDHLLGALTPLYLGWVASWVRTVRDAGPKEAQDRIEGLCSAYETQKGYLISRWRWPDRFNP
jgi:glucosylglycerate synthase